jgi:rRNA maturation endonuclease Nob1
MESVLTMDRELFTVFIALLAGLPVFGLWLLVRRGGRSADHEGRCGKCGYIVKGLPTLTCPECGSDLRAVGISVGASHGRG